MMYWYGSCTGGMNSEDGLQCAKNGRQVSSTYAISEDNRKRKRAARLHTYVKARAPLPKKKLELAESKTYRRISVPIEYTR
jgi:hypothetical protein